MEKKIKLSENKSTAKTLYGILIAGLCVAAIVIGIIASVGSTGDQITNDPPLADSGENQEPEENNPPAEENPEQKPEKLEFISPVSGTVMRAHDLTVPVFSTTLEEWRVHAGIDISTEEGATVFAAEKGEITRVYTDAMLGHCIEITHGEDTKSVYSNLNPNSEYSVKVGETVEKGQAIGTVGDSSISELADEPHLHLEFIVGTDKVNPLDYISEEAKSSSLGIGG